MPFEPGLMLTLVPVRNPTGTNAPIRLGPKPCFLLVNAVWWREEGEWERERERWEEEGEGWMSDGFMSTSTYCKCRHATPTRQVSV